MMVFGPVMTNVSISSSNDRFDGLILAIAAIETIDLKNALRFMVASLGVA